MRLLRLLRARRAALGSSATGPQGAPPLPEPATSKVADSTAF